MDLHNAATMTLSNDARGWVMTCISGIACVLGAAFTCVDLIVRLFPGKKGFRIEDSDSFLGCSLSLSAGVMLFSALYSMLPSSKQSLVDGGSGPKAASWILIACFLGGVFGIQLFSRIVHHFMPSHAVDCDHTHDEDGPEAHANDTAEGGRPAQSDRLVKPKDSEIQQQNGQSMSEVTPLLSSMDVASTIVINERRKSMPTGGSVMQRPSMQSRMTGSLAHILPTSKHSCSVTGPCFGYTDPCGNDCFKKVSARGGVKRQVSMPRRPAFRSSATTAMPSLQPIHSDGMLETAHLMTNEQAQHVRHHAHQANHMQLHGHEGGGLEPDENASDHNVSDAQDLEAAHSSSDHHHHVPKNAFLSISLQTSIAIALHKLPEGFITYATNHANPRLGFTIFLAIAVHNTSEGFALALPIFLASGSRIKALVLTLILGGLSQPLGAAVAAGWLKIAERDRGAGAEKGISDGVYGGMFAVTAGIMASVAISLIQESFELSHNRNLCLAYIFIGMGVLGVSSALTA